MAAVTFKQAGISSLAQFGGYRSSAREKSFIITAPCALYELEVQLLQASAASHWVLIYDGTALPTSATGVVPFVPPVLISPGQTCVKRFEGLQLTTGLAVTLSTVETYTTPTNSEGLFLARYGQ